MIVLLLSLVVCSFAGGLLLPLNAVSSFSVPLPPRLALPASPHLTVAVALCSSDGSSARFFLGPSEIVLVHGIGGWSGPGGAVLSVVDLDHGSFQVSVSDTGATFSVLDQPPLLGDSTANQAILFSHPLLPALPDQPSYPNYTLPPANLAPPDVPSALPNVSLVIAPSSHQLTSLPQSACALLSTTSTGSIASSSSWLRDPQGWRSQWLVDGLSPATNYTAYVVQDSIKLSGPIYFTTKSASFPCPLVHSLPYCPSTAYAVPLPPLPAPAFGYNATSLPENISSPLLQYMTNFTTMLSTFACGRDLYSPLQTCADCLSHYRTWLCSVSFPRCSEPPPSESSESTAQVPFPALQPQQSGSPSRNPYFPNPTYDYSSLLPCLETCNAVDRACPYFLGIKCPTTRFNAAASYGVGFIDGNEIGDGLTGVAQDRWGNVWCNAG